MKTGNTHTIDRSQCVICIRDLYKSFDDLHVLRGINLDVYKGENVAVLGKSGTGKSVLIKIIAGLLKPDSGSVNVLGKEVDKLSSKELDALRLHIGFSFQNSALYDSMTIRENLEFPLMMNNVQRFSEKEISRAAEEVLDDVGLIDKLNQMPSELSGGQRKRVGIARTLIMRPQIMLYDEPTAGLDPVTSTEINALINEVQSAYNTSSVVITHDLTCAKATGDRIAMLLDGIFLKTGEFEEVFADEDKQVKEFYNYNFINKKI